MATKTVKYEPIKQAVVQYTYTVVFERAEEGGYLAYVPALNWATTQGETLAEARAMAKDLIQGYVESLLKGGQLPPQEPSGTYQGEKVSVGVAVSVLP